MSDLLNFSDYEKPYRETLKEVKEKALKTNYKTAREISNEIALESPFGKRSLLFSMKTLKAYLIEKGIYYKYKTNFTDLDLESIFVNSSVQNIDDLPYLCKKGNRLRIIQHIVNNNFEAYFKIFQKQSSTYLDNFNWFSEGNDSNVITFHFFVSQNRVQETVCTMGSDIFDCLKMTTEVNASGGFTIKNKAGEFLVNPVLIPFKEGIYERLKKFYYGNEVGFSEKFPINKNDIIHALDKEFRAEGDYQRAIDWIFENIGVTTSFKDLANDFRDKSKSIKAYRLNENKYLPFLPNFDPIFNDTVLKAFGINPNTKINDYFFNWEKEDIVRYQLLEKEVNWVYGFNAAFCGFWNGIIDTVDGFILLIPELYGIFTDRAKFKTFLHLIKEFFEHISELMDKIDEWDLKNSSFSIYRYEYFQTYGITLIMSLFLPLPKLANGGKSTEVFSFFNATVKTLTEREIILLAYKLGLRIEKTGEKWTLLFNDIAITAGAKEKIVLRVEQITKKGTIPIDEAFGLGSDSMRLMNNLNLQLKINVKTIDIIETGGTLFFRLDPQDLTKLIDFLKLAKPERRLKIKQATQDLRLQSKAKYNPASAKAKGFNIPKSKNGISADFAKTPYLYNENSIVKIRMTGDRALDFKKAFEKMGITDRKLIKTIDEEYVWHHLDDLNEHLECTMQLVHWEAHNATIKHIGSCGQISKVINIKYK